VVSVGEVSLAFCKPSFQNPHIVLIASKKIIITSTSITAERAALRLPCLPQQFVSRGQAVGRGAGLW